MSMTREEAITNLEKLVALFYTESEQSKMVDYSKIIETLEFAAAALRHQIWEEKLWRDAKTDPPKTPGLYYGKTDDTNSMYACQYRDGVWVLDMYPQQKMEIVQWADYTAFVQDNVESALRPVSREQMKKVHAIWNFVGTANDNDIYRCSNCGNISADCTRFCPNCGAPMTDEAVGMVLERMEALKNGKGD